MRGPLMPVRVAARLCLWELSNPISRRPWCRRLENGQPPLPLLCPSKPPLHSPVPGEKEDQLSNLNDRLNATLFVAQTAPCHATRKRANADAKTPIKPRRNLFFHKTPVDKIKPALLYSAPVAFKRSFKCDSHFLFHIIKTGVFAFFMFNLGSKTGCFFGGCFANFFVFCVL